jgi:lipoprotein-releasing system permease protein
LNFPLYIAKRYIQTTVKNNAINIINRMYEIIVGAMALFVVLSVFSGLKVFSLSFTNEIDPDLKISSTLGNLFDFAKTRNRIKDIAGIASYTKIIECFIHF